MSPRAIYGLRIEARTGCRPNVEGVVALASVASLYVSAPV